MPNQPKEGTIIYSREQLIEAIHKLAAELGRAPRFVDLQRACPRLSERNMVKLFGTYARALNECGMESVRKRSTLIPFPTLFADWAQAARKAGKCPSAGEYVVYGNYSVAPFIDRAKSWKLVPKMMDEYIRQKGLEAENMDLLGFISPQLKPVRGASPKSLSNSPQSFVSTLKDRPVYGRPLLLPAMACAPVNEAGVAVLFGMVAEKLGFTITHVQSEFPDCEAMRRVGDERWQRVRIEFEFESMNFVRHMHRTDGCDIIVCWRHNWRDCPLEVIELSKVIESSGDR
jgi:HNH endonuclease